MVSLGTLFLITLPCSAAAWVLALRARGQVELGHSTLGEGQATAALWIARIGVVAGIAAGIVLIALLASGFDFDRFRDDLRAGARAAPGAPDQRRPQRGRGAARRDRPLGSAAPGPDPPHASVTPNPFIKQYLMTAGPTPVPPAVSQAMAAPMLYHRAPAFDELYERVLGRLPHVFATRNPVLAFAASGSGALESAVANLVRPGTRALAMAAGKFGERWIQLCEAYGADLARHEPGWGVRFDAADVDRLLDRAPRDRGRVHDAQRDLHGHRARHQGDRRGDEPPRRAARRRRGLRPGRRPARAGRVGRRRRRRRLAEGADDAARASPSRRSPSARWRRPRPSPAAATTSTGAARRRARRRARARSPRPSPCSSGSTSRSA